MGVQVTKEEISQIFDLCKTEAKGYLNLEEFKELYKNQKADELFRFFIRRSRQINQNLKS